MPEACVTAGPCVGRAADSLYRADCSAGARWQQRAAGGGTVTLSATGGKGIDNLAWQRYQ